MHNAPFLIRMICICNCSTPTLLGERLHQLPATRGLDHCFFVKDVCTPPCASTVCTATRASSTLGSPGKPSLCPSVVLTNPSTGRRLELFTDQQCVQIYSGGYLCNAQGVGTPGRGRGRGFAQPNPPSTTSTAATSGTSGASGTGVAADASGCVRYGIYGGIAFEPQAPPDALRLSQMGAKVANILLAPGERYCSLSAFRFSLLWILRLCYLKNLLYLSTD